MNHKQNFIDWNTGLQNEAEELGDKQERLVIIKLRTFCLVPWYGPVLVPRGKTENVRGQSSPRRRRCPENLCNK